MAEPPIEHSHAHSHATDVPAPDGHLHRHEHAMPEAAGAVGAGDGLPAGSVVIEHLHHVYPDGTEALRGIDLAIGRGEKVALVGPNGAGKSTLILHLNGILEPSHGSVRIGGEVVDRRTARRVRALVGLVFQDPDDQLFSPTVYEDVAFGPLHMGVPEDEIHGRVERALGAVGLAGFERRMPHRLSLGERKRAALATVLSMDPAIVVLDEPTAGLDPRGRRELIGLLSGMGQTMIVSTHDMRLVAEVFPRTIILDAGRVAADGPTGQLLADAELLARHGLEAP